MAKRHRSLNKHGSGMAILALKTIQKGRKRPNGAWASRLQLFYIDVMKYGHTIELIKHCGGHQFSIGSQSP